MSVLIGIPGTDTNRLETLEFLMDCADRTEADGDPDEAAKVRQVIRNGAARWGMTWAAERSFEKRRWWQVPAHDGGSG